MTPGEGLGQPDLVRDAFDARHEGAHLLRLPLGDVDGQSDHVVERRAGPGETACGVPQRLRDLPGEISRRDGGPVREAGSLPADVDVSAAGADGDVMVRRGLQQALGVKRWTDMVVSFR